MLLTIVVVALMLEYHCSKTALSFTTTNAVPTLTSSVPADDATDVERDANIILNFSENVDAESGEL